MRFRVNPEHRNVRSFGFRIGYWYCIPSMFVQVNVGRRYWSFWAENGDHYWTPAELSADRRVEPVVELPKRECPICGYETDDPDFDFTHMEGR